MPDQKLSRVHWIQTCHSVHRFQSWPSLTYSSALKPLSEFPRLLATVNEQGQTLLRLAIHLQYRELVQKLIHWGIDLNVRDVNGFTALHVGNLCDDPFVIGLLEAKGATPLVLAELGRSPTELAASASSDNGVTTGKDGKMVPLAVGYINRSKQPWKLPDRSIPVETEAASASGLSRRPAACKASAVSRLYLHTLCPSVHPASL